LRQTYKYMKIHGFTILKSVSPVEILDHPSPKTIEAIGKLINNPQYSQFRENVRKVNNVPENGFDINMLIGQNLYEHPIMKNEQINYAMDLLISMLKKQMDLSKEFAPQLYLLFFFNAFIDIEYFHGFISKPIQFILTKKKIAPALFDIDHEIGAILIPFSITRRQFDKWLDEHWDDMTDQKSKNIPVDPYVVKIHKNTVLGWEIIELKDKQEFSYSKISSILTDKYPDDDRVSDVAWVIKTYRDYKRILNTHAPPQDLPPIPKVT
jgi:hypothetical protein